MSEKETYYVPMRMTLWSDVTAEGRKVAGIPGTVGYLPVYTSREETELARLRKVEQAASSTQSLTEC